MVFTPAENTARCEIRFLQDGQQVENTLWFQHTTGVITEADREALGEYLEDWWNVRIRALQSNEVTYREVYVVDWSSANSGTTTVNTLAGTPGAQGTTGEPNNVTVTISFRTAFRGRGARGRNYAVGLTDTDVSANEVAQVTLNAWRNAYQVLLDSPPDDWQWVIASFWEDKVARTTALLQPVNAVVIVDQVVDSQRRRLPGRGK